MTDNNKIKLYVNGHGDNYFNDLYWSLGKALKTVFITDWFFSP